MNGKTYAYLDVAALPAVGIALLDPRPAWVFSGDGTAMLWANEAGARFFGADDMGALLERRFGKANPLVKQLARLSRILPTASPRLEILRFAFDFSASALPAACRRINLPDGKSAVFAISANAAKGESVVSRAESLADTIAGTDCLVAIIAADGRIIGASGGFEALAPASATIDTLADSVSHGDSRIVKRSIEIDGKTRPAGAARFEIDGEALALLIVGPADEPEKRSEAPPTIAEFSKPLPSEVPTVAASAEQGSARVPTELPAARESAPVIRFLWQIDDDQRFTFVSGELGRVVGTDNADIVGTRWQELAERMPIDRDGNIQNALDTNAHWSGIKVYWPVRDADYSVAAELSAFPIVERGVFAGFRGLGLLRPDDRRQEKLQPQITQPVSLKPSDEEASTPEPEGGTQSESEIVLAESEIVVAPSEDIDDAARKSVEQGLRIVAGLDTPPAMPSVRGEAESIQEAPKPSNVVRLPGAPPTPRPAPDHLSGSERDAFRRIAETLGVKRGTDTDSAPAEIPDRSAAGVEDQAVVPAKSAPPGTKFDVNILDRLPVGLVVYRGEETLFANRVLLDLLGYETIADFAACGGADALFPDREADWAQSATGTTDDQLTALCRNGRRLPVEARLQSVTWTDGAALMLSIRERPPQQEPVLPPDDLVKEIASVEARLGELEAILDTATDGVIVIDGNGLITNFNRSAEALFGVEAGDVLGNPFTTLLAEESKKAALDYLDGLAANGVASVLNDGREVIGKVPQGGLIPLFMTMGRLGRTEKFCAVLRDITHWKNAEEELVAARRAAEAANSQKSEFLAKISHEIRTPLNAIIGFSEVMMEERFGPVGNARYRDYLRDIHVSGAHLMSLINDLLDLSKIEAGKLELSFESVAINEAIQECVALMQPQANQERIIIRTSLSAGVPNVVADIRSLRQILLNLLSNAIKFTQAGGQVIVSAGIEENGEVAIRVRDTGVGMSEKDVEMALKPFRQLATSGRARGEGTGLGLPLTKALVEANRATFTIDSAVNQGTLVKISFPTTRVLAG